MKRAKVPEAAFFPDNILLASQGRLRVEAEIKALGEGLLVVISGGKSHIGALALAVPGRETALLEVRDHREGPLAMEMAFQLCSRLKRVVAVCAGIHYDNITRAEIDVACQLCREITAKIISRWKNAMKIPQTIDEFIYYLRSGELETDFKSAGENERGEILELLEKVMDAGDLANEVATRLIFRGLPGQPGDKAGS